MSSASALPFDIFRPFKSTIEAFTPRDTLPWEELAPRVLHCAHADGIPWSSPDLNVRQVNWRELKRWGISEARVPAGTVIKFRDPSVWDRYGVFIAAAAIVLLE